MSWDFSYWLKNKKVFNLIIFKDNFKMDSWNRWIKCLLSALLSIVYIHKYFLIIACILFYTVLPQIFLLCSPLILGKCLGYCFLSHLIHPKWSDSFPLSFETDATFSSPLFHDKLTLPENNIISTLVSKNPYVHLPHNTIMLMI